MKKIICLLCLVFMISGCSNKNISLKNTQAITYNDISLLEEDFDIIRKELSIIHFKKQKPSNKNFKLLKIILSNNVLNLKITTNEVYYEENNNTYISKNIKSLKRILNEIEKKYTDFSFFNIDYKDCNSIEKEVLVKLTNTSKCLTINSTKNLYDLKIHSLEVINNTLNEVNLLYKKDKIKNSIVIKTIILSNPTIKISFNTKYNYTISITPIYNHETKSLQLNTLYQQKNRP